MVRGALVLAAALLVVLALGSVPAQAAGYAVVEYKGTLDASDMGCYNENGATGLPQKVSLSWDATATTDFQKPVDWHFKTLTGTYSLSGPEGGCDETLCSATLSENPAWEKPGADPVDVARDADDRVLLSVYLNQAAGASGYYPALESNDYNSNEVCNIGHSNSIGGTQPVGVADAVVGEVQGEGTAAQNAALSKALNPQVNEPKGGPFTTRFDFNWSQNTTSFVGDITINSSLTVDSSSEGTPPSRPTPTKVSPSHEREAMKKIAASELKELIPEAVYPCIVASSGVTLATFGYASLNVAPLATGTALLGTAGPICLRLRQAIIDQSKIVKDPPSRDFERLAQPARPAAARVARHCSQLAADARPLCQTMVAKLDLYETAIARVRAISGALVTTIDRLSGAIGAKANAAARKQADHGAELERELDVAEGAQASAGEAIASLFTSYRVGLNISKAHDRSGLSILARDLAKQGLSDHELRSLAGPSLRPAAFNELSELSR